MCGYCIEGEALALLQEGRFDFEKTLRLAEVNFSETYTDSHLLPEFAEQDEVSLSDLKQADDYGYVTLWAMLNQLVFYKNPAAPAFSEDVLATIDIGFLGEEAKSYSSVLTQSVPAFTQLLTSRTFVQFVEGYQILLPELILEARVLLKEVSRDFVSPYFIKSDEDSSFPNMMHPSFEEEEHDAFHRLPITMLLAADTLIQHDPDCFELTAATLHIYPTPIFSSIMMAWQRKIAWHWYCRNSGEEFKPLGLTMRRELIFYIAAKLKSQQKSVEWLPSVASSMLAPVVNINSEMLIKSMRVS